MKRKNKIFVALVCVASVIFLGAAALAAGGIDDPLVTLSYLTNVFTPKVEAEVDQAVAANEEKLKSDVNASISAWEIARLQKDGKVVIPVDVEEFLADLTELYGLSAIPPNDDIMLRAANLPDFHKDPADRIIIATALIGGMPIVTGDTKFPQYGVKTVG